MVGLARGYKSDERREMFRRRPLLGTFFIKQARDVKMIGNPGAGNMVIDGGKFMEFFDHKDSSDWGGDEV